MATKGDLASPRSQYERRLEKVEKEVLELNESLNRTLNELLPKVNDLLCTRYETPSTLVVPKQNTVTNTSLFKAVSEGDENTLLQLLDENVCIQERNDQNDTVLHLAATAGQENIVNILLGRWSTVDLSGHCNRTPLLCAAAQGHYGVVDSLLRAGANVNAKNSDGNSALHLAASTGHLDVVVRLLNQKAVLDSTNDEGNSAVVSAAKAKKWNVVEFLLRSGASLRMFRGAVNDPYFLILKSRDYPLIHQVLKTIDAKDSRIAYGLIKSNDPHLPSVIHKCFPGFFNSEKGERIMNIVLRNGTAETLADILKLDEGIGPNEYRKYQLLANACILGKTDSLKMLIDEGVSVHARFKRDNNCSALHYAAKYGHVGCVRVLIDAGVPLNCRDSKGIKPRDLTSKNEIIELLEMFSQVYSL